MFKDMIEITVAALQDKKAYDIKALDITKLTAICDGFVIASASNKSQLDALVDGVEEAMYKNEYPLMGREGRSEGGWVLLDYGDIVIHLFSEEMREFYNIDGSGITRVDPFTGAEEAFFDWSQTDVNYSTYNEESFHVFSEDKIAFTIPKCSVMHIEVELA